MKFKAFISYRHSENGRRHAAALETALKRYAKPTLARPMSIFRDEKHMKPDISLPGLIRDGLENAEYLIFLAEKSAAVSQWCGEELEYWCNPGKLNRTQNLIIILIDDDIALHGTTGINWEKTDALPALLQPYLQSIPLYVDLRWAKLPIDTDLQHPRYRHEINALSAKLRGVTPEELNDEEIRVYRRNLRLRNGVIGALLSLLLVLAGATWWAVKQQKTSEKRLRENLANDLAYKSAVELARGDRNTAFQLAAFGHLFAQPGNPKAVQGMIDARYHEPADTNTAPLPLFDQLSGFNFALSSVAFSPDGTKIAAGCGRTDPHNNTEDLLDSSVVVWDLQKNKALHRFHTQTGGLRCLRFAPDGQVLALADQQATVKIYDLRSGKSIATIPHNVEQFSTGSVSSMLFIENGRKLAIGYEGGNVLIWDLLQNREHSSFYKDFYDVQSKVVAFSPDGTRVAMSFYNIIEVSDLYSGQLLYSLSCGEHHYTSSLTFSPDGNLLACGSAGPFYPVEVWDTRSRKLIQSFYDYDTNIRALAFSPDGAHLAVGCGDEQPGKSGIKIWDVKTGEKTRELVGHSAFVTSLDYASDGQKLLSGSADATVKIWSLGDAPALESIKTGVAYKCFDVSPDGALLAIGTDSTIVLIDRKTTQQRYKISAGCQDIEFSADGARLLAHSWYGPAWVIDVNSGKQLYQVEASEKNYLFKLSDDGRLLLTGSDKTIRLRSVPDGKILQAFEPFREALRCAYFLNNKQALIATPKEAGIFELDSGHKSSAWSVGEGTLSPDKQLYMVRSDKGKAAEVYDVSTRKLLQRFDGFSNAIESGFFSPDSKRVGLLEVSTKLLKIWDIESGVLLRTIPMGEHAQNLHFSPDGNILYSGYYDEHIFYWNLDADQLAKNWNAWAPQPCLTYAQLRRFDLQNLLELDPANESILLKTQNIWQIAAFADLYANKVTRTTTPLRQDYERAKRLYSACLSQGSFDEYFIQKLKELDKLWKNRR